MAAFANGQMCCITSLTQGSGRYEKPNCTKAAVYRMLAAAKHSLEALSLDEIKAENRTNRIKYLCQFEGGNLVNQVPALFS